MSVLPSWRFSIAKDLQNKYCFPGAAFDSANSFRAQDRYRAAGVALRNDRDHSDTHVEDLEHFFSIHLSVLLQHLENARNAPGVGVDYRIAIFWQNPRQIINQSAAGNVGEALDHAAGRLRKQRLIIFMHAKQLFA